MVKQFALTEEEAWYLQDLSKCINEESNDICFDLQYVLLGNSILRESLVAVNALIVYFGNKVQAENDTMLKMDDTCRMIAKVLKCDSYQVVRWIKGIAFRNDRFGKFVQCADTFGQNYLEIKIY